MQSSLNSSVTLTLKTLVPQVDVKAGSAVWGSYQQRALLCEPESAAAHHLEDGVERWRTELGPEASSGAEDPAPCWHLTDEHLMCSATSYQSSGAACVCFIVVVSCFLPMWSERRPANGMQRWGDALLERETPKLFWYSVWLYNKDTEMQKLTGWKQVTRYDWKNCWSINHQ